MSTREAVAHDRNETCPCCGSRSQFELYLENGFGFDLHATRESVGFSWGEGETEPSDFWGFYLERRTFLWMWLRELEVDLEPAECRFWSAMARVVFARGIEQEAQKMGISLSAADVTAELIQTEIEMPIVLARLGPSASDEEIATEYMRMVEHGLTAEEAAFVNTQRENIAGRFDANKHEFSRHIARRLRDPGQAFRHWRVVARSTPMTRARQSGFRAPRARRSRRSSQRARSPGRRSANDSESDHHALACPRCRSGVVVLRGIRTCGACWAYFTLALEDRAA